MLFRCVLLVLSLLKASFDTKFYTYLEDWLLLTHSQQEAPDTAQPAAAVHPAGFTGQSHVPAGVHTVYGQRLPDFLFLLHQECHL